MKPEILQDTEFLLDDLKSLLFYSQFIDYEGIGINGEKERKRLKKLIGYVKKEKVEKYMNEEWLEENE